jgi:hypothetical protein
MTEHQEQAGRLDDEADEMQERSEQLADEISDARQDWEAKKADDSVPGTPPGEGDQGDGDGEREPWPDE